MKKLFLFLTVFALSFVLVACDSDEEEISELQDGISELESKLSALESQLNDANQDNEDLNSTIGEMDSDMSDLDSRIDALLSSLESHEGDLSDLEGSLSALESMVDSMDESVQGLDKLIAMYIDFNSFEFDFTHDDEIFIPLSIDAESGRDYNINWSSESSSVVFREIEQDGEMVFGALLFPSHNTGDEATTQDITLSLTLDDGDFEFTNDYEIELNREPGLRYQTIDHTLSVYSNNRNYDITTLAVVTDIEYTDAQGRDFVYLVDKEVLGDNDEVLENALIRLHVTEDTPEMDAGDEIYFTANLTSDTTGRFFTPQSQDPYYTDLDVDSVHVLSTNNAIEFTTFDVSPSDIRSLTQESFDGHKYHYEVTGQLFYEEVDRFEEGASDGDDLYPTEIFFIEFLGSQIEFYGLTDDQKDTLRDMNGEFVQMPVFFDGYESMFGDNLVRVRYIGDGSDVTTLSSSEVNDFIVNYIDESVNDTDYTATRDQRFDVPVGRIWDNVDDMNEYLNVQWSSDNNDLFSASASGGVRITAPYEEDTINIEATIQVRDFENSTDDDLVFHETERSWTFTLETNRIPYSSLSIENFMVDDYDWLEGMHLEDDDSYWDDWGYSDTYLSNQDDITKIIDGDRNSLYRAEVEPRANGWNDYITIDIGLGDEEEISSVMIDSGVTGGDKLAAFDLFVLNPDYDDTDEDSVEWIEIDSFDVPNDNNSEFMAEFDPVTTSQIRIFITDSDQKFWGCCYTVRLAQVEVFTNVD